MIHDHLSNIVRIVFLFSTCTGYPYSNHTITLERQPYGFKIIFYYFYNSLNQRIDIPWNEKIQDFNIMIDLLYDNEQLRASLIPYTANPFPKSLNLL